MGFCMKIISHRGFFKNSVQNSLKAFEKSFDLGLGIETDIRDYCSKLVISHDIATHDCSNLESLFDLYNRYGTNLTLALNIKSNGLQKLLKYSIEKYNINNYFVFDMSVPDSLGYIENGLNTYTRQSEYELNPPFYDKACGIWIDEFFRHWITDEVLLRHLENNKEICIVSPDLHNREYMIEWGHYKEIISKHKLKNKLMLCTDKIEEARNFFYD